MWWPQIICCLKIHLGLRSVHRTWKWRPARVYLSHLFPNYNSLCRMNKNWTWEMLHDKIGGFPGAFQPSRIFCDFSSWKVFHLLLHDGIRPSVWRLACLQCLQCVSVYFLPEVSIASLRVSTQFCSIFFGRSLRPSYSGKPRFCCCWRGSLVSRQLPPKNVYYHKSGPIESNYGCLFPLEELDSIATLEEL